MKLKKLLKKKEDEGVITNKPIFDFNKKSGTTKYLARFEMDSKDKKKRQECLATKY